MLVSTPFLREVVKVSLSLKPAIGLAVGVKIAESGKASNVYAKFNLSPDCKAATLDQMLKHLEAGNPNRIGEPQPVKVSIPKDASELVRAELSPVMAGEEAAALIRKWGKLPKASSPSEDEDGDEADKELEEVGAKG